MLGRIMSGCRNGRTDSETALSIRGRPTPVRNRATIDMTLLVPTAGELSFIRTPLENLYGAGLRGAVWRYDLLGHIAQAEQGCCGLAFNAFLQNQAIGELHHQSWQVVLQCADKPCAN